MAGDRPAELGGGPLRLLVLQPTPYCNLDCDYCYLTTRDDRSRLSLEVLDAALERVLSSAYATGPFTMLWHAGEPLTLPPSFYDAATDCIQTALARHGLPPEAVLQSLQTNGISITDAWCDCFARNRIHVGVSIDGPAFLHDAHRRTRSGKATLAAALRGLHLLQQRQIPFNVISVLTAEALDHADALFDFYVEHGISEVGFNMEETEGDNRCSSLASPQLEARYSAFLERFWQRTMAAPGMVQLREFHGIASLACSDERMSRTDMNHPFVIVNVDVHGNVSSFDPELLGVVTERFGSFAFGNVLTNSLEQIAASERFQQVQREMAAGVEACRSSCAYFGLCGGGAGSNKYFEHGRFDVSETQACRYRVQRVADVVLAGLERQLGLAA